MSSGIRIGRLREDQIEAAVEVLAASYSNESYSIGCKPDPERRFHSWQCGFLPDVKYCFCHGEPHAASIADRVIGVALWMPPHCETRVPEEEHEFGLDNRTEIFGEAHARFVPLEELLRKLRLENMTGPHWFLRLLGIDPPEPYEQVGKLLLKPILIRADETGTPCYVETGLPRQLSLYQQLGFDVLFHGVELTSGIEYWTMSRKPANLAHS